MPTEEKVRAMVAEVVDAVLGSGEQPAQEDLGPTVGASAPNADLVSIAIGADHGGYPLKERIGFRLREMGYDVHDCGTSSNDAVDYPEFAHEVARKVAGGDCRYGIVIDGAGIGSCMAANKVPGVRAALCYDISSARNSRQHNHANVLTLGAGLIGEALAIQIVEAWLETAWEPGRHARRVGKIMEIERRYAKGGIP